MDWKEKAKRRVAEEAARNVEDGFVLGLGTGSTVAFVLEEIGKRIKEENLHISGVPTSYKTFILAIKFGIPTTTLHEHPRLDLDIDGADQIDDELNLIKGKGGALTKEKIVAAASEKFVIVADETKLSDKLGKKQVLPIEIMPFSEPLVSSKIEKMGGKPYLREKTDGSGPYVTDNGNFILDIDFGPIKDLLRLENQIKSIPGVIETGLFIKMADMAYIGTETTVKKIFRP